MSQQATLSPSPILLRNPISATFTRLFGSSSSRNTSTPAPSERRRLSHPHNPPQEFRRSSEDMSEQSQQQRPQLLHQASQTLIDLTDDTEDFVVPRNRARSQRPPQLGRSDAQAMENVIDLTEDNDVEITSARELPRPEVARHVHFPGGHVPARNPSPQLFVPHHPALRHLHHDLPNHLNGHQGLIFGNLNGDLANDVLHDFAPFLFAHAHAQAMPGQMDYQREAFADRKPDHVPPEPAKTGFTRSPTENDTVICPSCEEELVHNKDTDEPIVKKGGKAPTRKEREEHPFWVVRECGHVSLFLPHYRYC